MRSAGASMPTERRTRSSLRCRWARMLAGMAACDISQGRLMEEVTPPQLTVARKSVVERISRRETSRSPVSKEMSVHGVMPIARSVDSSWWRGEVEASVLRLVSLEGRVGGAESGRSFRVG